MKRQPRPGCWVTIGLNRKHGGEFPICGLPVVRHHLCQHHLDQRIRLGGKP